MSVLNGTRMNSTQLDSTTGVQKTYAFQRERSQRTNWLSTNCPSFAAANQVVTLTRVTNERRRRVTGSTCYRSVQFLSVNVR